MQHSRHSWWSSLRSFGSRILAGRLGSLGTLAGPAIHADDLALGSWIDRAHDAYLLVEVGDLDAALHAFALGAFDPFRADGLTTPSHVSP